MKVTQAANYWLEYHKVNSKKKYHKESGVCNSKIL